MVLHSKQAYRPTLFTTYLIAQPSDSIIYHLCTVSVSCLTLLSLLPQSEKSTSSSKNPSKAPVVSQPAKVPEDKTSNTHFGVVIHDRGRSQDEKLFDSCRSLYCIVEGRHDGREV